MIRKRRSLSSEESPKRATRPRRVPVRRTRVKHQASVAEIENEATQSESFLSLSQNEKQHLILAHAKRRRNELAPAAKMRSWVGMAVALCALLVFIVWLAAWGLISSRASRNQESLWGILTGAGRHFREDISGPSQQLKEDIHAYKDEQLRREELVRRLTEELARQENATSSAFVATSTARTSTSSTPLGQ